MNIIKNIIKKVLPVKDAMSFKAGLDLCSLPVVTFYQGHKKFNFLLDTGSNNSIISKEYLEQVEHMPCNEQSSLFGMEGKAVTVDICIIPLSYKDKTYKYPYLIQDMSTAFNLIKKESGVTLHGIIGSNFFKEYEYVLDFCELIAYSKK